MTRGLAMRTAQEEEARLSKLLAGVQAGDRAAFNALVDWFWEPVLLFFWKRVKPCDSEDLAQDVFIGIYRAVRNGQGPQAKSLAEWRAYLFTAAHNTLRSHFRRRARSPAASLEGLLGEDEPWEDVVPGKAPDADADPLVADEEELAVRACMEGLDEAARAICWLHFADGRSKREIAASLKIPESSLRDRMVHTLRDLRHCLESKGIRPSS